MMHNEKEMRLLYIHMHRAINVNVMVTTDTSLIIEHGCYSGDEIFTFTYVGKLR